MTSHIDGKAIAAALESELYMRAQALKKKNKSPKLAVLLVGEDKASRTYVQRKKETAARVGIDFSLIRLPKSTSKKKIIQTVLDIQSDTTLSGLIVQLPLPEPLYTPDVLNAIDPRVDVDCLTDMNLGKLVTDSGLVSPPTPGAVMTILNHLHIATKGKQVTIIGTGALVGKPLAIMMMNAGATVTTCNSKTKDIKKTCLTADIIVSAVGKKNILTADMVKKGSTIIDAGIHFENKKTIGDVDVAGVAKKAAHVTPTPGGVGPVTVAQLLLNTVILAEHVKRKK